MMLEHGAGRGRGSDKGHGRGPRGSVAGTGVASSRARFERRAAAARRRPRVLVGAVIAVGLVMAATGWLLMFSSVLTASTVEIRGVTGPAVAQVRAVAKVPLGGPLMRVDTDAVAQRVSDGREWTDVTVSRRL